MLTLTIPNRARCKVEDFAEASRVYAELRDASGEGVSTFPEGELTGTGLYRVSYNGRVWDGTRPWASGDTPIYSPA